MRPYDSRKRRRITSTISRSIKESVEDRIESSAINTALKTLVSKEERSLLNYDHLVILFKAISEREFPFIVLVSGNEI